MSPSFPVRKNDPQIVHDLQAGQRDLRNGAVEAAQCRTFIVGGVIPAGLLLPPAFVAEHCSMSGVLTKLGAGTATVELHAHQGDTFAQSFNVDNTWQSLWEQPWAELLEAGDPFWIKVATASVAADPQGAATDLSFGVVFGGEAQDTGGNIR